MERKTISDTVFLALLISTMTLALNMQPAKATVASGDFVVTTHDDNRLLKLDQDGNVVWNLDMGSETMDAYLAATDGTIYLVSRNYLTKLDSNGNILWNNDVSFMINADGGPENIDVDPSDGSVYVNAGGGVSQAGVYKYDSSGNFLWHRQVNFQALAVNPIDGSVYANSYVEGVYKYDSNGNLLWNTYIGGYQVSYGQYTIAVDPSDGSAIALTRFGGPVVKLDANGNIVWQTFTTKDHNVVAVDQNRNAVYVMAGNWPYSASKYFYKLNLTSGDILWERSMSDTLSSGQFGIDNFDGNIYVGDLNGTLYKMEPNNCNIVWSKNLGYKVFGVSFENALLQLPIASFAYSPHGSYVGETVTFDASASYDPDGTIVSYLWDFGDGILSDGIKATHVYTTAGTYTVALTTIDNEELNSTATRDVNILPVLWPTMDVQVKAGTIHFRGEIAEFYVLVSRLGKPVDANISAMLYFKGNLHENLTASVEHVSIGVYRIPYTIPSGADAGTYALVVKANYLTSSGVSLESFLLSPTLTGWNAVLLDINGTVGTIKTDLGTVIMDLDEMNVTLISIEDTTAEIGSTLGIVRTDLSTIDAKLTALNNTVATIQTRMGTIMVNITNIHLRVTEIKGNTATIQTALGTLDGKITSVDGNIATIETHMGTVKADVSSVKDAQQGLATPLYVIMIPVLIIAAGAIILAFIMRRKS